MRRSAVNSTWVAIAGTVAIATFMVVMNTARPANAEVLNVAWDGERPANQHYIGLGAAPDGAGNTYWNSFGTAGQHDSSTFSTLLYSDSSPATGVSIQLNDVNSYTPPGTATLALFQGQLNSQNESTTVSIDVKGLVNSQKYDVYLYSARCDAEIDPVTFTVNGTPLSLPGSANTGSFVLGTNYVKFEAQSPTNGNLNIAWTGRWGGPFNALQVASVPEPSVLALLVSGLVGLLAYAWRRHQ
jgi:hypothetical protein